MDLLPTDRNGRRAWIPFAEKSFVTQETRISSSMPFRNLRPKYPKWTRTHKVSRVFLIFGNSTKVPDFTRFGARWNPQRSLVIITALLYQRLIWLYRNPAYIHGQIPDRAIFQCVGLDKIKIPTCLKDYRWVGLQCALQKIFNGMHLGVAKRAQPRKQNVWTLGYRKGTSVDDAIISSFVVQLS